MRAWPKCRLSLIDARFLFPDDSTNLINDTPEKQTTESSGLEGRVLGHKAALRRQQRVVSIRHFLKKKLAASTDPVEAEGLVAGRVAIGNTEDLAPLG